MKPYYDEDGVTIYHADCREVLPTLDVRGALLLTDPPYGIGHKTIHCGGKKRRANVQEHAVVHGNNEPFDPTHLLSVGSARIFWGANWYSDKLPPMGGWLVWDKERPDALDQSTCELAWTDCVKGVRRFRHLWNGLARASEHERPSHPTQKPIALMSWCLGLSWTRGYDLVCDPYIGAGSTLVAAKAAGLRAIGIEIEEAYCEIAAERLRQRVLAFEPERQPVQQRLEAAGSEVGS